MPQRVCATLVENRVLAPHTFVLRLAGCDALAATAPGQFAMVAGADWGADPLLPRAFSLLAVGPGGVADILVKAAGKASALLERALPGARMWVLGPLGRPFPAPGAERRDWLVAGGVGLAPLYMQAAAVARAGVADRVTMFYGGRTAADLVMLEEIRATGVALVVATEDGSAGHAGYVTDAVEAALGSGFGGPGAPGADAATGGRAPTLMACGPEPMLHAVARLAHRRELPAYLSLEGEMACGIGACLACAVPCTTRPFRYTCVDGPVFDLRELAGPYARDAEAGDAGDTGEAGDAGHAGRGARVRPRVRPRVRR